MVLWWKINHNWTVLQATSRVWRWCSCSSGGWATTSSTPTSPPASSSSCPGSGDTDGDSDNDDGDDDDNDDEQLLDQARGGAGPRDAGGDLAADPLHPARQQPEVPAPSLLHQGDLLLLHHGCTAALHLSLVLSIVQCLHSAVQIWPKIILSILEMLRWIQFVWVGCGCGPCQEPVLGDTWSLSCFSREIKNLFSIITSWPRWLAVISSEYLFPDIIPSTLPLLPTTHH